MDDLKSKVVLVTGASTGIGAGCARAFGAFFYFASERLSGYVTGQVTKVNGGQYLP